MILREFISKSLLDIFAALQEVEKTAPGTIICGGVSTAPQFVELGVTNMQSVSFELMVRADEHSGSEAKLNVVSGVVDENVKQDSSNAQGHSATLRFRVPINLRGVIRLRQDD
jgi:hypothetical protein